MSTELILPERGEVVLPWHDEQFQPDSTERAVFGKYVLDNPVLLPKPPDVPDDYVAYNPSAIWTIDPTGKNVIYVRVEPNRSSAESSHLGKAVVRPYLIDPFRPEQPLEPYYGALEIPGEDPALTRIKRRLQNGGTENTWLLSCVDAQPEDEKQNDVKSLRTRFYAGTDLGKLEHIADGPEWMKDIRIAQSDGPLGTEIEVYCRPQRRDIGDNGNISHMTLPGIEHLTAEMITAAPIIHPDLLRVGSGIWGGINDVIKVAPSKFILAGHRAWRTGEEGRGRHYETVLYGHDVLGGRIVELGVLATANMFSGGTVKDDELVDLKDVVFSGGGYNGTLDFMTFGVGDGNIGFSRVLSNV